MTAPLSPERLAELRRAASLARLDTVPELLDEIERFQTALADAATWVVRDVGIPVDMTTSEPPPAELREAIYRYCFDDPDGTIHGGDLTYDELVAFVDEEAHWLNDARTPAESKVDDLMAALEQSVAAAKEARKATTWADAYGELGDLDFTPDTEGEE